MRVLYVLATRGPKPFTVASSAGRFSTAGSVAEVTLDRAVLESCSPTELRLDTPASVLTGYDRVAFVTPLVSRCQVAGEADATEVLLNGRLFRASTREPARL
jgi:hypothetical protein